MQGIGLLLMTISFLGLVAGAGVVAYALVRGKPALIRGVAVLAGAWAAVYLVLLLGTSLASHETVLGSGQRKAFCGFYLDCHVGVSVEDVQRAALVGEGAQQEAAHGIFYLVTVRVSSDARRATLALENPQAVLIDGRGHAYARALEAEAALAAGTPAAFAQRVAAGGGYATTLVFEAPGDLENPKLLVTMGHPLERFVELFLIGDEDSLLHRKTVFDLRGQPSA